MDVLCAWMAGGAQGKIYSVTTGLVKENWDEKHPGMVKVEYFMGTQGKNVTGWIPVAVPYAYQDCGMYLFPEIGAEVVIAFNMGDRNCPIVIGCLWNRKNALPANTATEKNTVKRLKTKGGCEVVFTEEKDKESLEIHTPAGLQLRLDDGKQEISVEDGEKKNGMHMNTKDGEIKLFSDKKMIMEVGGMAMLTLDGTSKALTLRGDDIKADASKTYQADGQNVKIEGGQTQVKGKSQLSVESGGVAQFKGVTVKIN